MTEEEILKRIGELRKEIRDHFGGIMWTPISHDFGIYCDHAFADVEKLFTALIESRKLSE